MKSKRLGVILLSVVLVFASLSTAIFAATESNVKQYGEGGGYLAIGDSISRGYGTAGYYSGQADNYSYRTVEGSFPTIIANAVGCNAPQFYGEEANSQANYWAEIYPGQTLYSTMDLFGIEDGVTDPEYKYDNYQHMLNYYGYSGSTVGAGGETYQGSSIAGNVIDIAQKADLITIQVGMCDVFYRAMRVTTQKYNIDVHSLDIASMDTETITGIVATFIEEANWGYNYWENNYTKLIERIKELNPDATIVIVGSFNMLADVTLSNELITPVGSIFTQLTESMNAKYKKWADEYGVLYADISNTESVATENGYAAFSSEFLGNADVATHPSPEGNAYIARQILALLPEETAEPEDSSKNIVVDMGTNYAVNGVFVDGVKICDSNYSMDKSTLTVKCNSALAKKLTVYFAVNDTDKVGTRVYTLSYTKDKGYVAKRVYGTNDVAGLVTKPVATVKKLVSAASTAIKKLFGK